MTSEYNIPGHVCPETGRIAMTVAEAYAREDSPDRAFWLYSIEAAAVGLDCWRQLEGIDASLTLGDDRKPLHYEVEYTGAGSTLVNPRAIVYMQRTSAKRLIKTADLSGPALDWAVACAEGLVEAGRFVYVRQTFRRATLQTAEQLRDMERYHAGTAIYSPSANWAQGGPIIERERISIRQNESGTLGYIIGKDGADFHGPGAGPKQPLVAAMRCHVAAKLGAKVDVPEELK